MVNSLNGVNILNLFRSTTSPMPFLEELQSKNQKLLRLPVPFNNDLIFITDPTIVYTVLENREVFQRLPAIGAASESLNRVSPSQKVTFGGNREELFLQL